jgi:hypothetical protein
MLDELTSGYSRKDIRNVRHGLPMETNIGRLFSTFAWGLQFTHEQADKILLWDNLGNAKGAVLDRYGANFGVTRNGANDTLYRLLIKVKMIALLSGGDIDTVLNAAAALFDVPVESVGLKELFPAKIAIHLDETLLTDEIRNAATTIAQLMKRILAAGVGLAFCVYTEFTVTDYTGGIIADCLTEFFVGDESLLITERETYHAGAASDLFKEQVFEEFLVLTTATAYHAGAATEFIKEGHTE